MTSEELGRLLSLISHEVRGPLGVMRGYVRLLDQQGGELSDLHRHAVAASLRAGERATEVLNQLSALARLHRGEVTPSLKPAPLEPLLRSVVHAVVMPPEPVVTIHVGEAPDVAVAADEELLRTAVAALTGAVVRAQPADNRVRLSAREDARPSRHGVVVTIAADERGGRNDDDGPLDLSRGGLGLDLPIASFIVDAHHGEVCERRAGTQLTGFTLWLPLTPAV